LEDKMILPCTCKHEGQDKLHGKGNRVHNPHVNNMVLYGRCTVCLNSKPASRKEAKAAVATEKNQDKKSKKKENGK